MKFALQLYTIRDCYLTANEFLAVLKQVREIGYEGVEFAGYAGLPADELKAALDELELIPVASHESVERLENNLEEVIAYNRTLGCRYIVCAYSPAASENDMERLEHIIKAAQKKAAHYDMLVLYHNHSHEFSKLNERLPIDIIKNYCMLEPDTYWIFNSKNDPADFLRKNSDNIGLVHLKDGDGEGHPCAIGEGINDIASVLKASMDIGVPWVVVENDFPEPNGLSDAARSMQAVKAIKQ
jgi:sugar phosphate isomerase/epimerase